MKDTHCSVAKSVVLFSFVIVVLSSWKGKLLWVDSFVISHEF